MYIQYIEAFSFSEEIFRKLQKQTDILKLTETNFPNFRERMGSLLFHKYFGKHKKMYVFQYYV